MDKYSQLERSYPTRIISDFNFLDGKFIKDLKLKKAQYYSYKQRFQMNLKVGNLTVARYKFYMRRTIKVLKMIDHMIQTLENH